MEPTNIYIAVVCLEGVLNGKICLNDQFPCPSSSDSGETG